MMKIVAVSGMASAYMTQSERDETFGVLMLLAPPASTTRRC